MGLPSEPGGASIAVSWFAVQRVFSRLACVGLLLLLLVRMLLISKIGYLSLCGVSLSVA